MIANLLRVSEEEIQQYISDSQLLADRIYDDNAYEDVYLIDLDKAWDGIIFLLTGGSIATTTEELSKVVLGGEVIDEQQDLGYGPARFLTAKEMTVFSQKINNLSEAQLKQKFDPTLMKEKEAYPDIWEEGQGAFYHLFYNFEVLQTFYQEATDHHKTIISFIR
ncbi:MAG: YfbM family protein [Thermonemataceae bacterium]